MPSDYKNLFGGSDKCGCGPIGCKNPLLANCEAKKISNSTTKLFANEPVVAKANLFGVSKGDNDATKDIKDWLVGKNIKTTANRIHFILNGQGVSNIQAATISEIGQHHISESAESNRCVDNVVGEFALLKPYLDEPKTLILGAVSLIEGKDTSSGLKGFLTHLGLSKKPDRDWPQIRKEIKQYTDLALSLMKNCIQYRVEPFISGLNDAKYYLEKISTDLDNAVNTLDYVVERVTDPMIQDLARRRKEMFAKAFSLMQLNIGQLDSMTSICEKSKAFATELEITIVPIIENVMRSSVIDDVDGNANINSISDKLKAIL